MIDGESNRDVGASSGRLPDTSGVSAPGEARGLATDDSAPVLVGSAAVAQPRPEDLVRTMRMLLAAAPCAYVVTDHHGRILTANRSAGDVFGCADADLLGRDIVQLAVGEDRKSVSATVKSRKGRSGVRTGTMRLNGTGRPLRYAVALSSVEGHPCAGAQLHWALWAQEGKDVLCFDGNAALCAHGQDDGACSLGRGLQALHQVNMELTRIESIPDFCRAVIVLGRERLGFDRLGLWLLKPGTSRTFQGTFGTDEGGMIRDESDQTYAAKDEEMIRLVVEGRLPFLLRDSFPLYSAERKVVGTGTSCVAALWDGERILGYLASDNLLTGRPIASRQAELLKLYAVTVGHCYRHKLADRDIRQSEAAERSFSDRLHALHEATNELVLAQSRDELSRLAVEMALDRLGFDRVGIWFTEDGKADAIHGSWGTDAQGRPRCEIGVVYRLIRDVGTKRVLRGEMPVAIRQFDPPADDRDDRPEKVYQATVPLWDGRSVLGTVSMDNLIHRRPITRHDVEILRLFASDLGHLVVRQKSEEALRADREAERDFRRLLQRLHEGGSRLAAADSIEDLFRVAVQVATGELGFDRVGIWLADEGDPALFRGTFGIDPSGTPRDERDRCYRQKEGGLMMKVASGRIPYGIRPCDPTLLRAEAPEGRYRQTIVPLRDGQRVMGVVTMDNLLHGRHVDGRQIEVLRIFASDLGHLYTRRLAEEALRRSEENYRLLIETQTDMVIRMTPEKEILFISPSACRTFALREGDAVGTTFAPEVHVEDRRREDAFIRGLRLPPHSGYMEERMMTIDGMRWVAWSVNGLLDRDGTLVSLVCVGRDITDRRREEDLLRVSEFAISSATNAIAIADLDGRINSVNRAFLNAWGPTDPAEVIGRDIESLLAEGQYAPSAREELERRGRWSGERIARRSDGSAFHVHMTADIVKDKSGKPISLMASFVDMTERQEMEKLILEAGMAERRRIGHDLHDSLGQALTGVAFLSKTLESNLARQKLPQAPDAARIVRLVDESITLTRMLARGLQPVTLGAGGLLQALDTLAADTSELYRTSCTFDGHEDAGVDDEFVASHLYHIAEGAVSNVVRHARASNIAIRLARTPQGTIELSIADDGIGMNPEALASKGMGMRTMRYRASVIGGSLNIDSREGRGTVVACVFPQPDEDQILGNDKKGDSSPRQ
jgi:two-component system CheB/CheR fusion protein